MVVDESGEDYLDPADYSMSVELPQRRSAWHCGARGGGARRTSRFSRPALALLAPAAERQRWYDCECQALRIEGRAARDRHVNG
jgi:hypothetical protein